MLRIRALKSLRGAVASPRGVRRSTAPLFPRLGARANTSGASQAFKSEAQSSKPFWTTTRTLLFSAFASTAAYLYGVTDASSHREELSNDAAERKPQYGTAKDLEKVRTSMNALRAP